MKTRVITRPPIARMQRILARLLSGDHVPATRLAVELEVTSKTIYRDIEYLRDQLNFPIATDGTGNWGRARGGYYLTKPVKVCPLCSRAHE